MCPDSCKKKPAEVLPAPAAAALYVHVPFCRAKCRYCDFYSLVAEPSLARRYVRALRREWARHRERLARPLTSTFVGGGTPSAIPIELLDDLLALTGELCDTHGEFTVEINPGTVDASLADLLVRRGVNRVSIGAQSFDPGELRLLGRIHDAGQTGSTVRLVRDRGIENFGLDLIYGIPGQDVSSWRRTLGQALDLGIAHLSCYALSFEPGTPLEDDLRAGRVREVDESVQRECYELAIDLARQAGLEHYEISNFARPGRQCVHNLTYWHNRPYLGLGPGAASYLDGQRRTNVPDLAAYLAAVEAGLSPPATDECLVGKRHQAETLMLELRLIEGVDRRAFASRFGVDVVEAFSSTISRYAAQGAVVVTPDRVRLSRRALFVADTILADLLAEVSL
ncbi:MAG: Oxygen-independent coproporphyrinogen-III oxidase 1 [Planctomycetes bacterium ADurb.Bin126]|nr:MAG: Oxygen-independent coproporphyrinogen-III oxidase 1 [Planctomycetes bacterium ADurb.Bin126]